MLWQLFITFAKIGVMTFGSGMAMLPILQREVVANRGWATDEELTDYYAIGQCTPGIIAVNTATFIGQKNAGTLGGIIATLGVAIPVLFGADILKHLSLEGAAVQWKSFALAAVLIILTRFVRKTKGLHPILFIAFAAVCGIIFRFAGV